MSGVLDDCRGRSTGLLERTSITDKRCNQWLVHVAHTVRNDVVVEHHSHLSILCYITERAGVVRLAIDALLYLVGLE